MPRIPVRKDVLVEFGKQFYERRWMWGTAGNLSLRVKSDPLEFLITPSGLNKGRLKNSDLLTIRGGQAQKHPKKLMPSAETAIHQAVYENIPQANAVFHVHAIYSTLASARLGPVNERRSLRLEWQEMLKGFGAVENESVEVPIFANSQDVNRVAEDFSRYAREQRSEGTKIPPLLLLYNHGVTVWGETPDQARNHLEVMEYLCQYAHLKNSKGA
jgi:methylthioribose-1-phosphate isomerase